MLMIIFIYKLLVPVWSSQFGPVLEIGFLWLKYKLLIKKFSNNLPTFHNTTTQSHNNVPYPTVESKRFKHTCKMRTLNRHKQKRVSSQRVSNSAATARRCSAPKISSVPVKWLLPSLSLASGSSSTRVKHLTFTGKSLSEYYYSPTTMFIPRI